MTRKPTPASIRQAAAEMAAEFAAQKLEVCKLPTDGGYIRVVVCPSPVWYQKLCRKHEFQRRRRYKKARTIIKRCDTLRTLQRIAAGIANTSTAYYSRIIPYVLQWIEDRQG